MCFYISICWSTFTCLNLLVWNQTLLERFLYGALRHISTLVICFRMSFDISMVWWIFWFVQQAILSKGSHMGGENSFINLGINGSEICLNDSTCQKRLSIQRYAVSYHVSLIVNFTFRYSILLSPFWYLLCVHLVSLWMKIYSWGKMI